MATNHGETVHDVLMTAACKLDFLSTALFTFAEATCHIEPGVFHGAAEVAQEVLDEIRRITGPEICGEVYMQHDGEKSIAMDFDRGSMKEVSGEGKLEHP